MSQVNVTINGRQFRMACEDGQEDRVTDLARDLDARIEGLRAKFGEIGDTRLTVMAALTVADELAEMGLRVKRLEQELAALQDARVNAADRGKTAQAAVAAALASAAGGSKTSPENSTRPSAAAARSADFAFPPAGATRRHAATRPPPRTGRRIPDGPRGCRRDEVASAAGTHYIGPADCGTSGAKSPGPYRS